MVFNILIGERVVSALGARSSVCIVERVIPRVSSAERREIAMKYSHERDRSQPPTLVVRVTPKKRLP
jgi:hypothetical protein